jgi:hypothetical protein
MVFRGSQILVLLFWLASMGWLVAAKIMPAMIGGEPPNYHSQLEANTPRLDSWRIKWNEQTIGFAASTVTRDALGTSTLRSVVQFDELPLDSMVRQLFGAMSFMVQPFLNNAKNMRLDMLVATEMNFDLMHQLETFQTVVDFGDSRSLLEIEGQMLDEQHLEIKAGLGGSGIDGGPSETLYSHSLRLPPNALVSDSVSPRPMLKHLHIGQSWTLPVYRAFPPNQSVQVVEATVERHEIIFWEGGDVETKLVVYRSDSGAKIGSAREPLGKEWVRSDGTILRQEIVMSGTRIQFERLGDSTRDSRTELLDADRHPRLWKQFGS